MYKETPVVLTEKPGKTRPSSNGQPGRRLRRHPSATCTVPMAEDESVEAVFSGAGEKALNPAEALTLAKGESTG